jgi:hypothetical protein
MVIVAARSGKVYAKVNALRRNVDGAGLLMVEQYGRQHVPIADAKIKTTVTMTMTMRRRRRRTRQLQPPPSQQ